MATKIELPLKDRITLTFEELTKAAAALNSASDDLADAIGPLDAAFKTLNLGVTAWHEFAGDEDREGDFWSHHVGYAKVEGKWGLAISVVSGNRSDTPDDYDEQEWLFNDAPRWMRVNAIDHIPALLETLVSEVNKTAADLKKKAAIAKDLAQTIDAIAVRRQVTK